MIKNIQELEKILNELEKYDETKNLVNQLKNENQALVEIAVRSINFKESLNEKQKKAFEVIQATAPKKAELILKLLYGNDELTISECQYLMDAIDDDDAMVFPKHIRVSTVQYAMLEYLSRKKGRKSSSIIRELLVAKTIQHCKMKGVK